MRHTCLAQALPKMLYFKSYKMFVNNLKLSLTGIEVIYLLLFNEVL